MTTRKSSVDQTNILSGEVTGVETLVPDLSRLAKVSVAVATMTSPELRLRRAPQH
jgi:hypothetical protein